MNTGEKINQSGKGANWNEALKDLMPLQINRFEINNGKISYKDFTFNPQIDIYLNNLNLVAYNLGNIKIKNFLQELQRKQLL